MKKLLGIVVLGLLLSGNAYSKTIVVKANPEKGFYHSKDTVCFYIFKTRDLRNEFVDKTKGMEKTQREEIYKQYLI